MDLTIAEQVLLVALDDEKGKDTTSYGVDPGLAAALLLGLARAERLRLEDDRVVVADGPEPSHPLEGEALALIAEDGKPRKPKHWVEKLPQRIRPLKERVADGLVDAGVLDEERSKVLGVFERTRWPEADPAPERELRERLQAVLVTGAEPTEQEAILIGILEPLDLVKAVVPRAERKAAKARAKEVAEHGVAGDAVRKVVRDMEYAMVAVIAGGAVAASGSG